MHDSASLGKTEDEKEVHAVANRELAEVSVARRAT